MALRLDVAGVRVHRCCGVQALADLTVGRGSAVMRAGGSDGLELLKQAYERTIDGHAKP